ncbi:MAG: hypothetical protein IJN09_05065, partial [Oscillospiraceae bacterium]|nr:hypothetical protein [Oscillospiraceae bacterium]
MATINSVIARVDAVKINTYTAEEKARWLIELEGRIFREILRSFGEYPVSEYPADGERELITPSPYDTVYDYYLFAMIDFHNRETENYNNSIDAFNQRYDDFAKEWHRTHCAPHGGGINTMGAFAGGDAHCGKPEKDITEIIEMHNAEKAAHPYILELIAKRYTALCEIVEQYRQLSAGVATDEDISNAVAEHQNSIFAHSELFEELKNEYAKLLSAHDENDYAHYETFKKHEDKLKEIAARALESLDEHSKDEDAHGIGEKINEIEERIRKLSITGGGNGVPVISVHDELYAEIVPEEEQVYVVMFDNVEASDNHVAPDENGDYPVVVTDTVRYRVKI